MLTRLKVSGFKNLADVDVRFGPFTCIAGANGVGKSNLFDAIKFLSALADDTLLNAALSVRGEGGKTSDIRSIFHRIGNDYDETMSFEAEMIIPYEGTDDLAQKAVASITFVRYAVILAYRLDEDLPSLGSLELMKEKLERINLTDAPKHLKFKYDKKKWGKSVLRGKKTTNYISTKKSSEGNHIRLSQDGSGGGRPKSFLAKNLPRTVLSTVNATESPTALLARREMQSWRLLQLEPSALREPDSFTTPPGLGADGSHLPATLYALSRLRKKNISDNISDTWIYDQIAFRLSELIDDVHAVTVDRDEKRELLTLNITDGRKTVHPARSLSDGTLRFLALAALELDPEASGLICLEEPENGIHPDRIPAILELLNDIVTDTDEPSGPDNPLRQVIINTHSPSVVKQIAEDSLLVAELKEAVRDDKRFKVVNFSWLPGTWRAKAEPDIRPVALGKLIAYLDSATVADEDDTNAGPKKRRRVMDRPDLAQMQFVFEEKAS